MCGIIGYIGYRAPQDVLMDGLTRLEYRGYDSAGLVWWGHGRMERVRAVGNLDSLRAALADRARTPSPAVDTINVGIGHWWSSAPRIVRDTGGSPHIPVPTEVDWDEDLMEKDGFETFMLKEIYEQPVAVRETLSSYRAQMEASKPGLEAASLSKVKQIRIVACGSSFHAGLAGKQAIERWARVQVEVDVASEFRYQDPIIEPGTLVLGITQSGETADTLAACPPARAGGGRRGFRADH
jgi:glucosamine 6-phosphate synthetase-like amidotransferase/phosphosugar isomerase protein